MVGSKTSLALLVCGAALVASGCATRGARSLANGDRPLAERAAPPRAYPVLALRNAGPTGLGRIASLRTDTPSYTVYEPAPVLVLAPGGDYGPSGVYGGEAPYVPCVSGGPCPPGTGSWGYVVGGSVPDGWRAPYDPGHDHTGLAGAIHGASPYHNPGDPAGEVTRPGLSTGSGPFAHHDEPASTPHDAGSRHGR